MAAKITRGKTFVVGTAYQPSDFHAFLEDSTISGIDATNMASGFSGVTIASTAPSSPNTGDQWYDTTHSLLKVYRNSQWEPLGEGVTLTFNGTTGSTGDVVMVDDSEDNSVKVAATADLGGIVGVLLDTATNGSMAQILTNGVVTVKTSGTINRGDVLVSSNVSGAAIAKTGTYTGNAIGIALTAATGTSTCKALITPIAAQMGKQFLPLGGGTMTGRLVMTDKFPIQLGTVADSPAQGDLALSDTNTLTAQGTSGTMTYINTDSYGGTTHAAQNHAAAKEGLYYASVAAVGDGEPSQAINLGMTGKTPLYIRANNETDPRCADWASGEAKFLLANGGDGSTFIEMNADGVRVNLLGDNNTLGEAVHILAIYRNP